MFRQSGNYVIRKLAYRQAGPLIRYYDNLLTVNQPILTALGSHPIIQSKTINFNYRLVWLNIDEDRPVRQKHKMKAGLPGEVRRT
jgi:hypothetical protein